MFGANDRIRIGAIGLGGRSGALIDALRRVGGYEIVALCDVYEPRRLRAKASATPDATEHVDYREVLDRKDIDAVTIATPDHWHVAITIDAVRAGKDVYCEKPVTHTLAEGRTADRRRPRFEARGADRHCSNAVGNTTSA